MLQPDNSPDKRWQRKSWWVKDASWFWIQFNMIERDTGIMVMKGFCCLFTLLFTLFFQATQCQSFENVFLQFFSLYLHGCGMASVSSCVTYLNDWFLKQEIANSQGKEFSVWLLFASSPHSTPISFFSSNSSSFFNSGRIRFPGSPSADFILGWLARNDHSYIPQIRITSLTSRDNRLNLVPPRLTIPFTREICRTVLLNCYGLRKESGTIRKL